MSRMYNVPPKVTMMNEGIDKRSQRIIKDMLHQMAEIAVAAKKELDAQYAETQRLNRLWLQSIKIAERYSDN